MENFTNCLVVGVSARALLDLERENRIFETEGLDAYCDYMVAHENEPIPPGSAFPLIKALLRLNDIEPRQRRVEVIIMSRNSADTSLRIFNSVKFHGLNITRAALSSGAPLAPYLAAFGADLFLSADEKDVERAINANIAAGIICTDHREDVDLHAEIDQIRIAFDGDAVLFSDESERIYKEKGEAAFQENEISNAALPLKEGPFAKFLMTLSTLQNELDVETPPIRTALVTARNAPAHERVIRTLRTWGVRVDEAFFLGGLTKKEVLKAFGAHIFFDDQIIHTGPASEVVATARVPYRRIDS